jgi:two-component system phosphate regulon sensor histidine kinase PhoR
VRAAEPPFVLSFPIRSWKGQSWPLASRIRFLVVMAIIMTTIIAGVPAYLIVHAELEREAVDRLQDGAGVTLVLWEHELARLQDSASLAVRRPTLQRLLKDRDRDQIEVYLRTFQQGTALDLIELYDAGCQPLSSKHISGVCTPEMSSRVTPAPFDPSKYALTMTAPVLEDTGSILLGYVLVGFDLDDDFVSQLSSETKLEQAVIVNGRRVASTIARPRRAGEPLPADGWAQPGGSAITMSEVDGRWYYSISSPVSALADGEIIAIETSMRIDRLRSANARAMGTLIFSTLLVISGGVIFAGFSAEWLARPLRRLISAAKRISEGDLDTPVECPPGPVEVTELAKVFEEGRVKSLSMLESQKQARMWFENLVRSIGDGIITLDGEGRIKSFNQGASRISGYAEQEVINRNICDVFRSAGDERSFLECIASPENGKRYTFRVKGDHQRAIYITPIDLVPEGEKSAARALLLRDVTEEESVRHLRSYFLANISHEFRTPLSALNASVELLLEELGLLSHAEISELLNSIYMSVSGLQTLIDNLLESMSIEAGHFKIRKRSMNVREVINDAVHTVQPILNRREQELFVALCEPTPVIHADPTRITQVIVNLLTNASKYSPMRREINLWVEPEGESELRICVADRGAGIPPEQREEIFRRFVRAGDHDEPQYGVGLGLSVVKAIVEGHGGAVGVNPREGGGSVFWITLPRNGAVR